MLDRRDVLTGLATGAAASLFPFRAFAETGVAADKIILGQAAVFEGRRARSVSACATG